MSDLIAWLEAWGLGQLAPTLAEQDIDLETLRNLTEGDLKELGLTVGLRRRLLHAIQNGLRRSAAVVALSASHTDQGAERRQLTVLFSDLAGSTELASSLDPEEMSMVLRAYQACCTAAIERYGGRISRFIGDGILAYFGYPQAHENDAERAVRAALDIVQDVPRLRPLGELTLNVRIGIATGQVIVGEVIGHGESEQIEVVGSAPNLAARLQSRAAPNGIVIGEGTRRLIGGLFECSSLGSSQMTGFPGPIAMWQVQGESAVEGRFDALHAPALHPMVGRAREFNLLMSCWERALAGEVQVACISGEPGVGKSRLLHALRSTLEPSGAYILTLYCSPYHQASALYPVVNYYERACGIVHDDSAEQRLVKLEELLRQNAADLERTVPILAHLLSIPLREPYAPPRLTPEQLKERTLELLVERIQDVSHQRAVLCLYEDVQWIDPTSSELLSRLASNLNNLPILLVIASRTSIETFRSDQPTLHLPLARLDRPEAELLLQQSLGGQPLAPDVRDEIIARADGIPLFLEELAKAVVDVGLPDAEGGPAAGTPSSAMVPASLHDSLMARLDRMSPVKAVAQLAAVLGRVFTVRLLSAAAPRGWQPIEPAIEALAAAEIILPVTQTAERAYQFKHALLQDVAYQSLLRTTRRAYHARVARALEESFPDIAETQPESIARHFSEADLADKAVVYWLKAGQHATRLSSNPEAISHLERGLALIDRIKDWGERAQVEYRLNLALIGPLVAMKGYASPDLQRAFDRAIHLSEETGNTDGIFPALSSLQAFEIVIGRIDQALVHVNEAIEIAKRNPQSEFASFAGRHLGTIRLFLGEAASARAVLENVLAVYQAERHRASAQIFGQDVFVASASYLSLALWQLGHADQAAEHSRNAIRHARALQHVNTLGFALAFGGGCFSGLLRDVKLLESTSRELLALSKSHGLPNWTAVSTALHGKLLVEQGHLASGIAELRAGIAGLVALNTVLIRSLFTAWLAMALAKLGDADGGLAALDAWWAVAANAERWMDAELHRAKGELLLVNTPAEPDAAERSFRDALAIARAQGCRALELRAATSLAQLLRTRRQKGEARAVLEPAVSWFTEGRDSPDFLEAASLLATLA